MIGFSRLGLVAPYRGMAGFMFSLVNRRSSQLIEVEATVTLSFNDSETGSRRFANLALEGGMTLLDLQRLDAPEPAALPFGP